MSRYSITKVRDNKKYTVSYGYDVLSEFFLHVEYADEKDIPAPKDDSNRDCGDEDNPELLFAISSYNTLKCHPDFPNKFRWNQSEILDMMIQWGVPERHYRMVALDLSF